MMTAPLWVYWLGFGCSMAGGFLLRYWVQARRFNRLSSFGIEQFQDYSDLWRSRLMEGAAVLVSSFMLAFGLGFSLLLAVRYVMAVGQ